MTELGGLCGLTRLRDVLSGRRKPCGKESGGCQERLKGVEEGILGCWGFEAGDFCHEQEWFSTIHRVCTESTIFYIGLRDLRCISYAGRLAVPLNRARVWWALSVETAPACVEDEMDDEGAGQRVLRMRRQ